MPKHVNSYDQDALTPSPGTIWVWEIDEPHARELIEVVEVHWNGEGWWVATKTLLRNPTYPPTGREVEWNDLGRFWEAVTAVGGNAERAARTHTAA
jgi:hypothetical protein